MTPEEKRKIALWLFAQVGRLKGSDHYPEIRPRVLALERSAKRLEAEALKEKGQRNVEQAEAAEEKESPQTFSKTNRRKGDRTGP